MRSTYIIFLLCLCQHLYAQSKYQKDFDFYWNTVNENFGYFDVQKTDWKNVKSIYKPIADTISSRNSFISFLEAVNNELYNGHISLNTNLPSSTRLIPTGADIWIKYADNQFIIEAIREGFSAELCGLKRGMRITKFNNVPISIAVTKFLPRSVSTYDERMYEFAANMLLAGPHNAKRKIAAMSNGVENIFYPDATGNKTETNFSEIIETKVLPSNIGYIKINNSLGNDDLIKAFDNAIENLWNTKALIIDLRETPSGGNTVVARAIMSRFIQKEMPYQKHSLPVEEKQYGVKRSWVEFVSPRGKIYTKPVVILVGRWTGSMGEGIAIGFDGLKRAKIVGDKMAGLLGAIYSFTMPETNIGFSIPVEKLFHINGTPRENFVPKFYESDYKKQMQLAIKILKR